MHTGVKIYLPLIILLSFAVASSCWCQIAPPDQAQSTSGPQGASSIPDRDVSWKRLAPNLLADQRRMWTFPVRVAEGQAWIPTAMVLATTAGLVALDPTEASYFRKTQTLHGFNSVFSGTATEIGTIVAPASLYLAGLVRADSKMKRTALFAGEAVADAEILATVLKDATKRVRPADGPSGGNYSDSWFESKGSILAGHGSFPSGHTIAAFSVATVIARRYRSHRWVPYAAYGMAALVGFSRLSLSAHFSSDVFLGAALGYSVSRFVVLQQ